MKSWNLSTKAVVTFSVLIALATGSLTVVQYWQLRTSQRQALQERLLEIVRLAASQIDGEHHSLVVSSQQTDTAYYQLNQARLQKIHDASDDIVRIYTIRQQPSEPFKYVLNYASEGQSSTANVGEVVEILPPRLASGLILEGPQVEHQIVRNNQNIPVLYGYAPIQGAFEQIDDLLVLELDARPVLQRELKAQVIALAIFLSILVVTWCVTWYFTQSLIVRPIFALNKAVKNLGAGVWHETIPNYRQDEFGSRTHSFNEMIQQLKSSFQSLEDYSHNLELKVEERTQELQESKQLLDLVMNNIPQSIFWKDRDSVYLGSNKSFAETAALTPESIIGKTDYELPWSKEEADFFVECDRKVMQSGKPELGIVEPISKGNGDHGWLETSKVPLYDLDGDVMGIIGIFQDITPYKEAEAAAQQASKAKSDFLANMSHELRTPLNGILGYAQILERSKEIGEKERHGVTVIHQCGSHLLTLINDILDLSKIEARKLELAPTALHFPALLQSVVEMCQVKAEQKGIDFIYRVSSRLPEGIKIDEKRLRQVLINLLGNAIKFTDSGSVTLQIDVLNQSKTHAYLLFQVIDTGVGIAEEHVAQLFEAFEQVGDQQKRAEGTGLGLAISQRIVQLMGSQIEVKSKLNQGTEFFFTLNLPLVQDWAQQQLSNDVNGIIGYKGEEHYTILIMDDRWENRAVISNFLMPLDFIIIEAENGQSGLDILEEKSIDLVITDISMPVMGGLEFLDHLRNIEAIKNIPVIVSSASVSQTDQHMALEHGGNDFLAKPVDMATLLDLVAKSLYLEWTYEDARPESTQHKPDNPSLVIPPHEVLEELYALAKRGRIIKMRSHLEELKESHTNYSGFIDSLLDLVQQFKAEEIEQKLQDYLTP